MPLNPSRKRVHPVGIDLGTTYSCLSYLTPEGQPVTLPNSEGELSTPSIVFFEGDEVVVGTEALRNSVMNPDRTVQHAKRFMGDPNKCWIFDGHVYRPKDISALIIRKLLDGAEERLGRVRHAVITVPAQFSDVQRQLTIEAGEDAGLDRVDIINEPVATAMCHVLSEGMWFAELAEDQTVLVFDLGGGTFDLSLVQYNQDEVKVIASGGDLRLGGLDWNQRLEDFVCEEYTKTSANDPRLDRETMQSLAIEIEQVKRSLSVRSKVSLLMQHEGRRKSYNIERDQFEILTSDLVLRTEDITKGMLKAHGKGWANVDSVLVTGGASRMPMIRQMLKRLSGTTLNTTLSPDQSIAHGAAFYAGMLLSGRSLEKSSLDKTTSTRLENFRQQSVTGRSLGILIRDPETDERRPHYLIPANTPLPCAYRQNFGTVTENQKRVHLHIVESGATQGEEYVELGECFIDNLPVELPKRSPIQVNIHYDEQGRVRVSAIELESGTQVRASIVRDEGQPKNSITESSDSIITEDHQASDDEDVLSDPLQSDVSGTISSAFEADLLRIDSESSQQSDSKNSTSTKSTAPSEEPPKRKRNSSRKQRPSGAPPKVSKKVSLEEAERPVPLCNRCGNVLEKGGDCSACPTGKKRKSASKKKKRPQKVSPTDPTDPMNTVPKSQKGPRHRPR